MKRRLTDWRFTQRSLIHASFKDGGLALLLFFYPEMCSFPWATTPIIARVRLNKRVSFCGAARWLTAQQSCQEWRGSWLAATAARWREKGFWLAAWLKASQKSRPHMLARAHTHILEVRTYSEWHLGATVLWVILTALPFCARLITRYSSSYK